MFNPEHSVELTIYDHLLTPLPVNLTIAKLWLDERPTLQYQLEPKYRDNSQREVDFKYHFLVANEYLTMAYQESKELEKAIIWRNKREELGDVLLLLLHFANASGITHQDITQHLRHNFPKYILKTNRKSIRQATTLLANSVSRDNHLLFGGPMSFEEGPWIAPRDSKEWQDYKQTLVDRWTPAYLLTSYYVLKQNINLTGVVSETILKVSYNFPAPFFHPATTPFHYHKYNYNARRFCRLIRSTGYLAEYHSLFEKNNSDMRGLGIWTYDILNRIRFFAKNRKHQEDADTLLADYSFNRSNL